MRVPARALSVLLLFHPCFGQSPETPSVPEKPSVFEVADVHMSAPSPSPFQFMRGPIVRAGRYELRNATMLDPIRTAYDVDENKVVGGPSWLESDRFDVVAKAPQQSSPESLRIMLQALLADGSSSYCTTTRSLCRSMRSRLEGANCK
jgi:hypothetical protein